jgi:hypothetical protein
MPDLDITAADAHVYDVAITDDQGRDSHHRVRVPEQFLVELGMTDVQEAKLVRASLDYLLRREPPSSILPEFTLEDIGRYFPDYPDEIRELV